MDHAKHNSRNLRAFRRFGRKVLMTLPVLVVLLSAVGPYTYIGAKPTHAANQIPKILNYQARITNASGVPVPDGNLNIWISVYNASSGGSCLYAMRGTCGTPSFKNVTVVDGVFSMLIGDMASGDVEIPESLFDNNTLFLGVTVASDTEMVPRKRIAAAPYALNADKLDDLDVTSSGSTTPYIPSTTANGNLVITGDPQGGTVANGPLFINPASASASETLFGIADNGTNRWMIDKEGDITHVGSLLATAASSTSQFVFRGAASHSQNIFEVQDSFTNRLLSMSATATTIGSTSSTDAVVFNSRVGSNLTPTIDNTFSLGDYNRRWRDLWLSGGSANIAYDTSGTSVMKIGIETATGYRGVIATPDNMPLQLKTTRGVNDTNGIHIATSGNVGIGNVTPTIRLNVGAQSNFGSLGDIEMSVTRRGAGLNTFLLVDTENVGNDAGILIGTPTGGEDAAIFMDESDARKLKFSLGSAVGTDAGRTSTAYMTIDQTGLVGIGTTSPTNLLHLKGSGASFYPLNLETTSDLQVGLAFTKVGRQWLVGTDGLNSGADDFFIFDATASAFRQVITSNGNVAFGGNFAPANKLTVGNATSTFEVNAGGNIVRINAVPYSWPSSQGGASTVLTNNGSGSLTWTAGSGLTNLNQAYLNSTSTTEIFLTGSQGALTVADTFSGTGNIFEIQNRTNSAGDYSQRYFTVSSTSTVSFVPFYLRADGANEVVARALPQTGTGKNRGIDFYSTSDVTNSPSLFIGLAPTAGWAHTSLTGSFIQSFKNGTGIAQPLYLMAASDVFTATPNLTLTTSGNVGVGTTGPLSKLDVNGGVAIGTYAGSSAAPSNGLIVSGNAGIGTTSGASRLTVGAGGTGATIENITIDSGSGVGGHAFINFSRNSVAQAVLGVSGQADSLITGSAANDLGIRSNGGNILFSTDTGTTAHVYIKNGGNVGIGNRAPANRLTVGNATSTFEVNAGGNIVRINAVPYSWPSTQGGASTVLQNNGSGTLSWVTSPGGSTLQTAYDSSTGTTEIFLGSARGALTLADSFSSFNGNLFEIQNRTNGAGDYSTRYFTVSSTSTLINPNTISGYKVGVGTSTPQTAMHIYKGTSTGGLIGAAAQLTLQSDTANAIQFTGCDSCTHYIDFGDASSSSARGRIEYNGVLSNGFGIFAGFATTPVFSISSSKFVGINTSAPQSDLMVRDLSGSPTDLIFSVSNFNDSSRYFTVSSTATVIGSASTTYVTDTTMTRFTGNLTPSADNTYTLGDPALRWKDLWLSGGSANIAYDTSGTSVMKIGIETATGYRGVIATPDNMPLQLKTTRGVSDTNGVYIATSGNVGIGANNPGSYRLKVNGDVSMGTTLDMGADGVITTSSGNMFLRPSSSNVALFDNSTSYNLDIYSAGTQAVHLGASSSSWLNGGNVGIGTSSPGARLTVRDGSASPTTNIFQISNSNDSSRYFTVSSTNTVIGAATSNTTTINGLVTLNPSGGVSDSALTITGTPGYQILTTDATTVFNIWNASASSLTLRNTGGGAFSALVVGDFSVTGNATLGDSTSADSHTINGSLSLTFTGSSPTNAITATYSGAGQTADRATIGATNNGTYDTTSGNIASYAVVGNNTSTRSAGANVLHVYGVYGSASGAAGAGGVNAAVRGDGTSSATNQGFGGYFVASGAGTDIAVYADGTDYNFFGGNATGLLYNAGALTINGNATLGDADSDAALVRGSFTIQKIGVDSYTELLLQNDAATWAVGTYGSTSDDFAITKVGAQTSLAINTSGQTYLGDVAPHTSIPNDVNVLTLGNTGTGQTTDNALVEAQYTGSFTTAGGNRTSYAANFINTSTESAGGNTLSSVGTRTYAAGSDVNYGLLAYGYGSGSANYAGYFDARNATANVSLYVIQAGITANDYGLYVDGRSRILKTTNATEGLTLVDSGAGQTVNNSQPLWVISNGTYNTTSGALENYGVNVAMSSARSAGANNLTNYAGVFSASGAQVNYALFTNTGDVLLNNSSGQTTAARNFTVNGNTTLGDAIGDTTTISGPASVGGNLTVAANVVLTQAGDTYIYDSLAASSGNQDLNLYSAGTGFVSINSNIGGITNGGTGGLRIYGGNNSSVQQIQLGGSGNSWFNSGNVGIGTTSPSTKLQVGLKVADDNAFSYDSNALMVVHQTPTATATLNDPKTTLILARQGTSGQAYGAGAAFNLSRYENNSVNSRTRLDVSLSHNSFDLNSNNVMTLLSSGNVGVGTSSPLTRLHVQNGNSGITFTPNARTAAIIEGNNTSGTMLSIIGPATANAVGIFMGSPTSETPGQLQYDNTTGAMSLCNGGCGAVSTLFFSAAGNFGMGNITPSAKLTLSDPSASPTSNIFEVQNTSGGGGYTNRYFTVSSTSTRVFGDLVVSGTCTGCGGGSTTLQQAYDNDANGGDATITTSSTDGDFVLAGDQDFRVTTSGNSIFDTDTLLVDAANNRVGIGTTSPSGLFSVVSSAIDSTVISATDTALRHGTLMRLYGGNAMSSGSVIDVASSTFNPDSNSLTGSVMKLNFTSINSLGTYNNTVNGLDISATMIGSNNFGTRRIHGIRVNPPTWTSNCTTSGGLCFYDALRIGTPAVTQGAGVATVIKGIDLADTGLVGAIVQNTESGTIDWRGLDIQMPAITQTTGTVTSIGVKITGGTVTSGTAYALTTSSAAGNVGIGNTAPASKLTINTGVDTFTVSSTGTVTLALSSLDNYAVCHSGFNGAVTGALLTDCVGSASADYMEMYPAAAGLTPGDIVMPGTLTFVGSSSGEVVQVVKTDGAYAGAMLGVVSNPNDASDFNSIGHEFDASANPMPVALKGRVKVKVNTQNGAIKMGDPITSSSIAGVGMKSTKPGMIVGQALEAWNGPGQGTILVFMGNGFHSGLAITTDGVKSLFNDDFAFLPPAYATSLQTAIASRELSFIGSAWDAASSTSVTRSITTGLTVTDTSNYQMAWKNDDGQTLAALSNMGDLVLAGSLSVNGGFDYAEQFPAVSDLEAGDIVMVDAENANGYGVKKTAGAYENSAIGVISTKPGFITGKKEEGTQPVALAGRVPVKVSAENGEIKPGDPITSSGTPGVGMKATEAGRVIGIALQGRNGEGVGIIMLFVNPSWWNGPTPAAGENAGGSLSIQQDSLLDFKNSVLSSVAAIISTNGLWGITSDGQLVAQKVEAKEVAADKFTVKASAETERLVGVGRIQAGYDAVLVPNAYVKPDSLIVVTFETNPGTNWWIDEKVDGHFVLKMAQGAHMDLKFTYWIVGVDGTLDPAATDSGTDTPDTPPPEPDTGTPDPGGGGGTGSGSGTEETP